MKNLRQNRKNLSSEAIAKAEAKNQKIGFHPTTSTSLQPLCKYFDIVKTAANYPAIETEPKSAFRAVLVCEDDASLKTGTETCRLLLSCFENRLPFQLQIWPFAIFQSNDLNLDAVRDAVAADAIIVATHRQNDLPPAIKDWINAWVPQKQTQTAILIGLFHRNGNSQTVPVVTFEYLKKAAKDAGMDFLVRQNVLEENTSEPPPQPQEPVIFANPEGWGLND